MTEWNTRGRCASPRWAQETDAAPPPLTATASKMHKNGTQSLYCRVQQNHLQRCHKTPLLGYSPKHDNEAFNQVRASSPQEWPAVRNLCVHAGSDQRLQDACHLCPESTKADCWFFKLFELICIPVAFIQDLVPKASIHMQCTFILLLLLLLCLWQDLMSCKKHTSRSNHRTQPNKTN